MAISNTLTSAASYTPNWEAVARYYTDLYNEYAKAGNKSGMQAAHTASQAALDKLNSAAASTNVSAGNSTVNYDISDYSAFYQAPVQTTYSPPSSEYQTFDDYYRNSGFTDLESQTQSLYNSQIQSSVDSLSRQKWNVEQSADELSRQAYIAYLRSRETLPQQLSAMGYNGGLSESRQVALESGWQDRRNQIGMERESALYAIDSAIGDAYAKGQLSLAGQLTSLRSQAQNQWNDYIRRQEEAALENYWKQVALENENYWKQSQLNYNQTQSALDEQARQQELAYQKQRDQVEDARYLAQQNQVKTQTQSQSQTNIPNLNALISEYQKQQEAAQALLKQQQAMLQQLEAARKLGK